MKRYTKKQKDMYIVDSSDIIADSNNYIGPAIDKLATFENIIEELLIKQETLSKELESLRKNNQSKTYKFRELLGNKLINSAVIAVFESHKLI